MPCPQASQMMSVSHSSHNSPLIRRQTFRSRGKREGEEEIGNGERCLPHRFLPWRQDRKKKCWLWFGYLLIVKVGKPSGVPLAASHRLLHWDRLRVLGQYARATPLSHLDVLAPLCSQRWGLNTDHYLGGGMREVRGGRPRPQPQPRLPCRHKIRPALGSSTSQAELKPRVCK